MDKIVSTLEAYEKLLFDTEYNYNDIRSMCEEKIELFKNASNF